MNEILDICLCSMDNRTSSALYKLVHRNHLNYAQAQGYRYFEVNDFSRYEPKSMAHFHKFDVINDALKMSEWAMWVDFDAVVTNPNIRIESFIPSQDAKLIISKDSRGGRCKFDTGHNNGVMIWRRCDETLTLLSLLRDQHLCEIFASMQRRHEVLFYDQSLLTSFLSGERWKSIVTEIPAKSFNSYIASRAEVGNAWEDGDFILHLAGMSDAERLRRFRALSDPMC